MERRAIAEQAQRALGPPPALTAEIASALPPPAMVSPEAWRYEWAGIGCAVGWGRALDA